MGFLDMFKRAAKETANATEAAVATDGTAVGDTAGAAATLAAAGAAQATDWKEIGKLLGEAGEKLSSLMDKLNEAGLDDKLKSWIGKGDNEPVSPAQVTTALGNEQVAGVAKSMGVSENEAASKIAAVLPAMIDKLTPDGLVPDPEALAQKLTALFK